MSACCQYAQTQPWDANTAAAICEAESGGDPNALGDSGNSRGLWQIYGLAHPQYANASLFDPATNAQAAYAVYQSQGWPAWSTYNNGAYRNFLGQCGGAASNYRGELSLPGGSTVIVGAGLLLAAVLLWDYA